MAAVPTAYPVETEFSSIPDFLIVQICENLRNLRTKYLCGSGRMKNGKILQDSYDTRVNAQAGSEKDDYADEPGVPTLKPPGFRQRLAGPKV